MMISAPTFEDWYTRLQELAFEVDWDLGEPHEYQEYYDDGDSPEETLAEEMSRSDDDDNEDDQSEVKTHYEH